MENRILVATCCACILFFLWYLAGVIILKDKKRSKTEKRTLKKICSKRSRKEIKKLFISHQVIVTVIKLCLGVLHEIIIELLYLGTPLIRAHKLLNLCLIYSCLPMEENDRCEYFHVNCPKLKCCFHLRDLFSLWMSQENNLKTNLNKKYKSFRDFSYFRQLYYNSYNPARSVMVMAVRSFPSDSYRYGIFSYRLLPQHVWNLLKPGDIFKLAHYFHYTGNGLNDEIRCIRCWYPIKKWCTRVKVSTLRCPKCLFGHLANINRPDQAVGGISKLSKSTSTENNIAVTSRRISCGGACSGTSCSHCHASNNSSTEIGNSEQSFEGRDAVSHDREGNASAEEQSRQDQGHSRSSCNIVYPHSEEVNMYACTQPTSTNRLQALSQVSASNNILVNRSTTVVPRTYSLHNEGENAEQSRDGVISSHLSMETACSHLRLNPGDSLQNYESNARWIDRRESSGSDHRVRPFTLEPLGDFIMEPACHQYCITHVRTETFGGPWPQYLQHLIPSLSAAGFFYCGYGDTVRCFFCKIELKEWQQEDDPWVEHALWSPYCEYLRSNKGDRFVCTVKNSRRIQPNTEGQHIEHHNTTTVTEDQTTGACADGAEAKIEQSKTQEPSRTVEAFMEAMVVQNTVQRQPENFFCQNGCEENCCTFIPCGHKIVCENCSQLFENCPKCKEKIEKVIRM